MLVYVGLRDPVVTANTTSSGAARPEHAFPLGLIWLKGPNPVDFLGLERVLKAAARIHKGVKAPSGETPASAVICCPTSEDDLAAEEVSDIRVLASDAPVLVFASAPNLRLARAALRAGASGLIHSGMPPEQIRRAVSLALQGEAVLPRELLPMWLDEQRRMDPNLVLRPRQLQILRLAAEGLTNAQIAQCLYLAESTIKKHLSATYKALGVHNRKEAAGLLRRSSLSGCRAPEEVDMDPRSEVPENAADNS
jgi:DNA-binding NarL/FixJ family response regulator